VTLLNMAVFGAMLSYLSQAVSFIILRVRFPHIERPYRSPLGVQVVMHNTLAASGTYNPSYVTANGGTPAGAEPVGRAPAVVEGVGNRARVAGHGERRRGHLRRRAEVQDHRGRPQGGHGMSQPAPAAIGAW